MEKKPGSGCMTAIVVFVILVILLGMFGSGIENDYDKAGRTFETWTKYDPSVWTDTERKYYNDFRAWADKN